MMCSIERARVVAASILKLLTPTGYSPWTCFVQAWHETAGFLQVVGAHNYWGVKAPAKTQGPDLVVVVDTTEYYPSIPGETISSAAGRIAVVFGAEPRDMRLTRDGKFWVFSIPQKFRDWKSADDAVVWWDGLIQRLYKDAFQVRGDPEKFFVRLVDDEYNPGVGEEKYVIANGKTKEPRWATDPRYADKCISLYKALKKDGNVVRLLEEGNNERA